MRSLTKIVSLALGLLIGVASVASCRWLVSWQHASGKQWTLLGGSIVYRAAHASKSGTSMSASSATTVIDQRHWLWPSFQCTWQVRDPGERVWPGVPVKARAWWEPRIVVLPVWLASPVLLGLAAWIGRHWIRRLSRFGKRRSSIGRPCVACGYSLAGHEKSNAGEDSGVISCPECGSQNGHS
ncbi:MAG: hypothetical protein AB7Q00_02320 [Phycisphaerales bacterium]|nr:MAG: hypothetical protein IPK69_06935 [Phycisphaerales bacterium]